MGTRLLARAEAARVQGQPGRPGRGRDFGGDALAEALKPEALDRAGRGLLLEVEDEDGSQALAWLR